MPFQFGIYDRGEGKGFGIFIKAVSGLARLHFAQSLGETWSEDGELLTSQVGEESLSRGGHTVSTVSERLKNCATLEGAKNWIIRFKHLSEEEQLARIGTKWIKTRVSHVVAAKVQYYAVMLHGKLLLSSYDLRDINAMLSLSDDAYMRPTVKRNYLFDPKYLQQLISQGRVELASTELKGQYAGFTAPSVTKIRRRRMSNADRHPGYRIVGSNSFWNKK